MQLQLDIFGDQPTVLGHTSRIVARSSDRIAWLRARSRGVTATDVRVVEVALGTLDEAYLSPEELELGAVTTRTVAAGELVPHDAVGADEDAASTTIVLHTATDVPASVSAGSVVEVWAAPLAEDGGYETPRILVPDATVVSVARDDAVVGTADVALEVVIPRADVSVALAAMADQSALSVVPAVGGGR